ncbi:uncharacterized protein MYCFIDRAFT_213358 [Pseudocercospora fijiensis CIRAD86]|uniref:non-specific serine/threonine protein kinase n=1 Tax=Pseudocercospora fijiensis (strain CIRAD86) TaxID=383855 RepID=N1QBQ4_PSEFD|nr:uncharacterized protein MYCFIDRAFT_213358 [Pseudocercospora fijiensis CIRAD86]EME88633.1 hypothetical protein MYCFIDRAFT_213358 [Pseudocercospora fijiensis CIRAD86]
MAHEDDSHHDGIGSGASTPPNGTATPRPDAHQDKRLPALHSYFAQVRDSFLKGKSTAETPAPASSMDEKEQTPDEKTAPAQQQQEHSVAVAALEQALAGGPLQAQPPTAPSSPRIGLSSLIDSPPLLPHEKKHPDLQTQSSYPTPPLSNSSSFLHMADVEASINGILPEAPPTRKRSWAQRQQSLSNVPSSLRRNTLSTALTSIVTKSAAAAHISNPSSTSHTAPGSPSVARPPSPQSPKQGVEKENQALTQTDPQNTPPQTPRSLSHVSRRDDEAPSVAPIKTSRSSSNNSHGATIGQLKGQLEIVVEEARGLRPATDPYVVCIFQLNEDISAGPKEDEMAVDDQKDPEENLAKGVAMKRMGSGQGAPMAIPGLRSRQTSQTNIADLRRGSHNKQHETTDPVWRHKAVFDVVGDTNEVDVSVYDRANNEQFIGHVRLPLNLDDYEHQHEDWYKLQPREGINETVTGDIHLTIAFHAAGKKTFGPDDFEILKLVGKGTFGQVFQVRKRDTKRIYAMKVLSKKVIVQKKEIQHTIGERNILVRTATTESPFIVGLKFSFQTAADLYLVTDYMSGGELFWHLQKEGRFVEERAKFYIAELILALRHLHQHDIVYRDLKPENILLDANGHIALCDFGLSKANLAKNDTTNTFCGTTEYLAPEVLLDEQGYTKMVDFWSLGVLVFEMCCGWSPFYAEDTQQMYKNIAFGKVRFPRDALSAEGRSFVKGLLNRNPAHRLGARGDAEELMAHPFFSDVDWNALSKKLVAPPFKPKLKSELDTSNFDPEFTNALTAGDQNSLNARAAALASGINTDSTPLSPTMQNQFKGFTFVDESTLEQYMGDRDVNMGDDSNRLSRTFSNRAGDRMSGMEPTSATSADADFNHGMLDDI